MSEFILTREVYFQTYAEQVAIDRLESQLEMNSKWQWLGFAFIPLILLVKISYTALCLNIGTLFTNTKIGFKKLFQIALIAESVFILAGFVRIFWLYSMVDVSVLQDVQYFYPLSLLNFFGPDDIERWFVYPLHVFNLFEVAYWIILSIGLSRALGTGFKNSLQLVTNSYGLGLIIWMVFVVFLSISLN